MASDCWPLSGETTIIPWTGKRYFSNVHSRISASYRHKALGKRSLFDCIICYASYYTGLILQNTFACNGIDNIDIDGDYLWLACHPDHEQLVRQLADPEGEISPSQVGVRESFLCNCSVAAAETLYHVHCYYHQHHAASPTVPRIPPPSTTTTTTAWPPTPASPPSSPLTTIKPISHGLH